MALAVLLAVTAPVAAGESDPDPLSLLPGRGFTETVGIGQDVVGALGNTLVNQAAK